MNRRKFLKYMAGGTAGLVLGSSRLGPSLVRAQTTPGVTSDEIVIGMSAAFLGNNAALGSEIYRGAQAVYSEVNAQGGINGRQITVVPMDDGYQPNPAVQNTLKLVEDTGVLFLSNYVGTPTLVAALPIMQLFREDDLFLVGNFTGAQTQREAPFVDQVFNVRASYRQEMTNLVDKLWSVGFRKFGVFYQIDAYGRSGTDGVVRGLAKHGSEIVAEATYRRGASFDTDMSIAVNHLREADVEIVLCTGAYQGCGAFIRAARDNDWNIPISNVSFVNSDAMLGLLKGASEQNGKDYTTNLINTQVMPNYDDETLPGVQLYRQLMDKWQPAIPEGLRDPKYTPQPYSFVSLEGFMNARVVVEALRQAGSTPTRSSVYSALETLNFDLGINAPLTFSPDDHQGLDAVYYTKVENGKWVPILDWSALA
jgi:branched-chain amino acid transport system substrate-binding protein